MARREARTRGRRSSAEEGDEALLLWLIWAAGGGEWARKNGDEFGVALCGLLPQGDPQADRCRGSQHWEARRATWRQSSAVTSNRGYVVGPGSLTTRARIGRVVRRGQAERSAEVTIGRKSVMNDPNRRKIGGPKGKRRNRRYHKTNRTKPGRPSVISESAELGMTHLMRPRCSRVIGERLKTAKAPRSSDRGTFTALGATVGGLVPG